ncbi:Nicastrin [Araneus ventricosus]|uniref:Nicastrin n=1 Tax=Araneus ventricosus TaxID=182803 RepID=A0A4Y2ASB0_ARAVE|nr:Nicastrin [Araneus ventricosus]
MFKSEAEAVGLNVPEAPSDLPLLPTSFQSFLKHDKSIPGIVIADHDKEFINKYYNSIFDTSENLNVTLLTQVSTAVSGTLYHLLTKEKFNETLDSTENLIYHYDWMAGSEENTTGVCIKSTVMYTNALSPAYVLNEWKSTEYSTWTESVWLETTARIFVQPGKTQEACTLVTGFVIFFLSIVSVYFINDRASIIFNTRPLVGC